MERRPPAFVFVPLATLAPLLAFLALACGRATSPPADAGPADQASAPTPAVTAPPVMPRTLVDAGALRRRPNLTCRALAVQGAPTIALDAGVKPLAMNDLADGWVSLVAGDSLTVRLPRTGRELAFVGPATFEPCVGTDEAWLLRGRFEGSRGSGESPGAEQWIVTPFAIVRYGAAIIDVAVDETSIHASLKAGSASILPEGSTTWQSLEAGAPRVVKGAPFGTLGMPGKGPGAAAAATASADRCAKASATSKKLEDELSLPDAAASPVFGDIAMRANDANVLARAECAIAKVRAERTR
jgi:hypothetical protein